MKVFISYSSSDRWIARRIAGDLDERRIETFLDEKDITTGESIDDAIAKHLGGCDEVLMLISPTSLKSHWVFMEVGGARALGKRVAPILLHVGANEVPPPLSRYLARDINDLDKYYEELGLRASPGVVDSEKRPPREPVAKEVEAHYSEGDHVVIVDMNTLSDDDKERSPVWIPSMDAFSRKEAVITQIHQDGTMRLDISGDRFWWAPRWLTKRE